MQRGAHLLVPRACTPTQFRQNPHGIRATAKAFESDGKIPRRINMERRAPLGKPARLFQGLDRLARFV